MIQLTNQHSQTVPESQVRVYKSILREELHGVCNLESKVDFVLVGDGL